MPRGVTYSLANSTFTSACTLEGAGASSAWTLVAASGRTAAATPPSIYWDTVLDGTQGVGFSFLVFMNSFFLVGHQVSGPDGSPQASRVPTKPARKFAPFFQAF